MTVVVAAVGSSVTSVAAVGVAAAGARVASGVAFATSVGEGGVLTIRVSVKSILKNYGD